ncbi:MAG: adenylate/guanylate cyclase domain-containing protein [Spirochaetota bacterium]
MGGSDSRPTGMVTFLFTDIEGSTRLWESSPQAMRGALQRHDAILREVIELNAGYIFKTVGDAFCASFARPAEAIEASLVIQKALAAEDWGETPIKVRMGLHTGEAEERGGDYFGPPVNRVARLMAVGAGGQVLLSSATAAMARGTLPPGAILSSLGSHRLKDLRDPEEIFQLSAKGLGNDFPPLKALDNFRHNLPTQLSSFIGRDVELGRLVDLLPRSRLLTLTGPGGCGKTRLALQAAGELVERFPEGVWFVDLAPMADPFLLPLEVAAILGIREEASEALPGRIAEVIGQRPILLILDNCEHIVAACAALVARLLRSSPGLRVVATSREALGIGGETLFPVEPLPPPDSSRPITLESAAANECVRLFVERASAAMPSFRLSPGNVESVARVCARLDGIPLAIELAAARVRVLSADQILARLDDRFKLLTGGLRGAQPRQQTLRDLIGWSYDLLSREERSLLRSLSVFASGWDLESAERVCGPEATTDILDLLEELVVKSLVVADESEAGTRFRMLESIREYARIRLVEEGEVEELAARHAAWFLDRAEELSGELYGPGQVAAIASLRPDSGNFLAAFDHFAARAEGAESALRLAVGLEWFHYRTGRFGESRKALEKALSLEGSRTEAAELDRLRARAMVSLAWIRFAQGELEAARESYTRGLEASRVVGDRASEARALTGLSVSVRWLGERSEGLALAEEGVAVARSSADARTLTYALIWAYATLDGIFDGEPPIAALEEGLALARQAGDHWAEAHLLDGLGDLLRVGGRLVEARSSYDESLRLFREVGDRFIEAYVLDGLGKNAIAAGAPAESLPLFCLSMKLFAGFGMRRSAAESFAWLALLASILGEKTRAARLFGAFQACAPGVDAELLLARHPAAAAALGSAKEEAAADFEAGRRYSFEEGLAFALAAGAA